MEVWESVLVAVTTAAATTGLAESVRWLQRRSDARRKTADWSISVLPMIDGFDSRMVVFENIGEADALDVELTITGNADYELHPDARLDRCRPNDSFLVQVRDPGRGIYRIGWRDDFGREHGPVSRWVSP